MLKADFILHNFLNPAARLIFIIGKVCKADTLGTHSKSWQSILWCACIFEMECISCVRACADDHTITGCCSLPWTLLLLLSGAQRCPSDFFQPDTLKQKLSLLTSLPTSRSLHFLPRVVCSTRQCTYEVLSARRVQTNRHDQLRTQSIIPGTY